MMEEFRAYLDSTGDVDGAVLMLDKVVELAPDTETGRYASLFKIGILANKDRVKARLARTERSRTNNCFLFPLRKIAPQRPRSCGFLLWGAVCMPPDSFLRKMKEIACGWGPGLS